MNFEVKQHKTDSENKTIRFPMEIIEMINIIAAEENVSFSSFVVQACIFSLKNLSEEKKKELRKVEQARSILD